MEDFKIESTYLEPFYEVQAFIRCMKADFYRPDFAEFLLCPLIKRLGAVFVLKHVFELLKLSAKPLKHLVELLKHSAGLLKVQKKTKVVKNRVVWHTFIRSQTKFKLSFLQYLFLTTFLAKKEYYGNEELSLGNLVYFYTILDTFIRFRYTFIQSLY